MEPVIEIDGLTKYYGSKQAVAGLTLDIPRGAIFALLGENGAGKTTSIRMLTGLLKPDAGRAWILGLDPWNDAVRLRLRVGYVPERPKFYDWMTVSEVGWFTSGFHAKGFLPRYRKLTDRFDLDPASRLGHLSKGQYAKVGLSLALASDPKVLILDEPTSGLDLLVRREFLSSMVDLAGEGRTIVISSHQVAEVERVASHVAFMAAGRVLLSGALDDVKERLVRLRVLCEGMPPDPSSLGGTVLRHERDRNQARVVLLDPDPDALAALRATPGVREMQETPLTLEEAYCALLEQKEELP
jgi:ABC-2 type transport system ATP-binding protein